MQLGKSIARASKNAWSYSGVEARVRDATSNDPAGPSVLQMSEIAQSSFNQQDCVEIVTMLDRRLNDKGKNWRHVWKSLTLLDYLAHYGNYAVVRYFRNNIHLIKTLKEFQHVDENGTDVGRNVREQAVALSSFLLDDDRLRRERGNGGKSIHDGRSLSRHLADPHALPERDKEKESTGRPRSLSQPISTSSDSARRARQQAREREAKEVAGAMRASKEDEERRLGLLRAQAGETLFGEFAKPEKRSNSAPLVELAPETGPPPQDPMQQLYEAQLRQNAMLQAQQQEQQQQALFALQVQQQQQAQAQAEANYLAFQQQQQQQQMFDAMAQQAAYEQFQAQAQAQYAAQMQMQQPAFAFSASPPSATTTPGANNPFAASFASPASTTSSSSYSPLSFSHPPSSSSPSLSPPPQPSLSLSPSPSLLSPTQSRPRASTTSALPDDHQRAQLEGLFGAGAAGPGVDTFGNVGQARMPSGYAGHH
ncbi:hypothetical protein JCM6882_003871 [Rhodosporidiobolus microsporus]